MMEFYKQAFFRNSSRLSSELLAQTQVLGREMEGSDELNESSELTMNCNSLVKDDVGSTEQALTVKSPLLPIKERKQMCEVTLQGSVGWTVSKSTTSSRAGQAAVPQSAMDQVMQFVEPSRQFVKDSIRLVKRCTKPDRKEFQKIAMAIAIGFAIMGFISFFVKLIHIPINNIIDYTFDTYERNLCLIQKTFLIGAEEMCQCVRSLNHQNSIIHCAMIDCSAEIQQRKSVGSSEPGSLRPTLPWDLCPSGLKTTTEEPRRIWPWLIPTFPASSPPGGENKFQDSQRYIKKACLRQKEERRRGKEEKEKEEEKENEEEEEEEKEEEEGEEGEEEEEEEEEEGEEEKEEEEKRKKKKKRRRRRRRKKKKKKRICSWDHHQPISVTSTPAAVSATLRPSPYKPHMSVSGTEKSISLQGSQA
ncbi:hypothetical protein U0070_010983 [Myodes glareolus]|uniref:Protein transport protein Sec61 subunit gamma n=1 Tax=Myodes glareolus TaxID=447135 RepID=A0AAW0ICD5_MYOGA